MQALCMRREDSAKRLITNGELVASFSQRFQCAMQLLEGKSCYNQISLNHRS